jgi:pyruvate ferredoxin oxidoreductase alpha subunit
MHLAALQALDVYDEIAAEFATKFGRTHDAIEAYRCEDAEIVFFMMGSFATKAKAAVDTLRAAGQAVGLVRPRLLRPFPSNRLNAVLAGKRGVAVIDQNLSMGKGGVLHAELASVLYGRPDAPAILASFIGGLGGRDITDEEFFEIVRITRDAVASNQTPLPRLLYTRDELLQIQKLQAIAHVERQELRENL